MSKFLSKNLAAKSISIIFALLLWIYVMSVINPRITREELNVPVRLVNENIIRQSGLVISGEPNQTIRVRLTGNRDQVHRISRNDIDATIDLRGYEEGTNSIPIEVNIPGGVEVDFSPRYATVDLERIVEKQIDVELRVEGSPSSGYVLGNTRLQPSAVWVEGPESYVNSIETIVARLELSDEVENISRSLPPRALNSRGEEVEKVQIKTSYVDVHATIDQLKTVPVDLDLNIEGAEGYRVVSIDTHPKSVTVQGQAAVLADIGRLKTHVLEIKNLEESLETKVSIIFPDQVSPFDEREIAVDIKVEAMEMHTVEVNRENIRFENLNPDLKVEEELLPDSFQVNLKALDSTLQNLDKRTIMIFVDLEDLEEGSHDVTPRVWLPMNVETVSEEVFLEPETFEIKLMSREEE